MPTRLSPGLQHISSFSIEIADLPIGISVSANDKAPECESITGPGSGAYVKICSDKSRMCICRPGMGALEPVYFRLFDNLRVLSIAEK